MRGSAVVEHRTHNPEVAGSNPAPASVCVHDWELVGLSYGEEDHETRKSRCVICGEYRYERDNG